MKWALWACVGFGLTTGVAAPTQAPPSQVQVARQFLLALTREDWPAAYQWLAPETRQQTTLQQFKKEAEPFREQVRQYGPAISLYKLGFRLREAETPQPFVAFSFKADTLKSHPHFQLDVTFRDSTARQVQGFGLILLGGR